MGLPTSATRIGLPVGAKLRATGKPPRASVVLVAAVSPTSMGQLGWFTLPGLCFCPCAQPREAVDPPGPLLPPRGLEGRARARARSCQARAYKIVMQRDQDI